VSGSTPSPFAAIVGYTVRACVPPRRRWLLGLPCLAAVGFGALATISSGNRAEVFAQLASLGIFSLVLPLACLVLGDAVLGAEVRSGTLGLTWMSPVPFRTIVVGRWAGATAIAAPVLGASGAAAAVVARVPEGAAAMALALAAGAAAYVALFIAIGAIASRAAVWSIVVVVLVERLLGTALSGIAQLSPMWQARAVYAGLGPEGGVLDRSGIPHGGAAVARLAIITAVLLAIASWRLAHIRLAGARD
jgi:ABC-2 type transport system permease protein